MGRWVGIKDPNVIRPKMKIKTCLDNDSPMYHDDSDDGDGDSEELRWFGATVEKIEVTVRSIWNIVLVTDVGDRWSVCLNENNLEYFLINLTDWDE